MPDKDFQTILGIRFFLGTAKDAITRIHARGGLVVVPSGPGMRTLVHDAVYREALLGADLAITDSGYMVLLWNLIHGPAVPKLSGLKYLRQLVEEPSFRSEGRTLWIMPSTASAVRTFGWLVAQGIVVQPDDFYIAPHYNGHNVDPQLLTLIEQRRPRHVIMGVGGGVQEPLGYYLKTHLSFLPAIHCIGAAIGFLTGDQVRIPVWVDALSLGWLWRILSDPARFFPRYWEARHLARLIVRYGERLPTT